MTKSWRVGELAAATGLTVRTLHHYDAIGLLSPSGRTGAGYRQYGPADVERLYRICLLRRLGLSLTEVGAALDEPEWSLESAMRRHHLELDRKLALGRRLQRRLAGILRALEDGTPDANELLDTLGGDDDAGNRGTEEDHAARVCRHRGRPRLSGQRVRSRRRATVPGR